MPRQIDAVLTNAQKARAYGRTNKLPFDVAYHLLIAANAADGVISIGIDPNAPTVAELSTEDAALLVAAKTAVGL